MEVDSDANLFETPVAALRPSTRQIIVNELNKRKVLATDEGLARDYRGLAHLTGLPADCQVESPADKLLTIWGRQPEANLGKLEQYLGQLDRWDIVDDIYHLIREDAKVYSEGISKCTKKKQAGDSDTDNQVLTYDDIRRLEAGLELQLYDALLLYADEDRSFAGQMLDRLENDYHLKVCLKENLVGGLSFEHQSILRLISERCRRVIIILSRSFFESPVNRFSVSFAQALAIETRQRIIIPCVYERAEMELPQEIRMLHKLDYNRAGLRDYNFWERLRASVVQLPPLKPRSSGVAIREINSTEFHQLKAIKPAVQEVMTKPTVQEFMTQPVQEVTTKCQTSSCVSEPFHSETFKCKSDQVEVKEIFCSTACLNDSYKISCSTLSLPEKKKEKSKSPSAFIRKLFRSEVSKSKKKSNKVAVRI